jgi:hypothetical protein
MPTSEQLTDMWKADMQLFGIPINDNSDSNGENIGTIEYDKVNNELIVKFDFSNDGD